MTRFRGLSLLMVRPWFLVIWFFLYFVYLLVANVVVGLLFNIEVWSVWYWVKSMVIAAVGVLVFFTWGLHLRWQGRQILRERQVDNSPNGMRDW